MTTQDLSMDTLLEIDARHSCIIRGYGPDEKHPSIQNKFEPLWKFAPKEIFRPEFTKEEYACALEEQGAVRN